MLLMSIWCKASRAAQGLAFLHENGVLHLDLKPDNVYRSEGDMYKIGDFGLAVRDVQQVIIICTCCSSNSKLPKI